MTKKWHSTYKIDHAEVARALADLEKPETDPDYSWLDDLPELPPLPETEDEVVAILIPRASRKRRARAQAQRATQRHRDRARTKGWV